MEDWVNIPSDEERARLIPSDVQEVQKNPISSKSDNLIDIKSEDLPLILEPPEPMKSFLLNSILAINFINYMWCLSSTWTYNENPEPFAVLYGSWMQILALAYLEKLDWFYFAHTILVLSVAFCFSFGIGILLNLVALCMIAIVFWIFRASSTPYNSE